MLFRRQTTSGWLPPGSRLPAPHGVYRAIAFVNHLTAMGHRVTVLTADEEYFELATGVDPDLARTLPDGIHVVRVPYADVRDPVINRWTKRHAIKPRRWREDSEAERDAIFPERYGAWRDRIVEARAARWRPIAARARQVWFVNPPIADLYRSALPEVAAHIRVVENSYDPRYFDPAACRPRTPGPPSSGTSAR